jgi:hypothetical protein
MHYITFIGKGQDRKKLYTLQGFVFFISSIIS